MTINGLDVSAIQGVINWNSVSNAGYKFVIVKCGNGNDGFDSMYDTNITGASASGLEVGTYHFVYPLPDLAGHANRNPVDQAKYHYSRNKTAIAAIDIEWAAPQDWAKWGQSANQINDWCLTYLETFTTLLGALPIVYTYPYFSEAVKFSQEITKYPLWAANYTTNPAPIAPWTDWVLWQTGGGTAKLPNGVPVDTDVAKDLSLWGK